MAEETAQKSWWEKGLDALKGLGDSAASTYEKYTAGDLNKKLAEKASQPEQKTNWYLVAGIAAGAVAIFSLVAYLLGRKN